MPIQLRTFMYSLLTAFLIGAAHAQAQSNANPPTSTASDSELRQLVTTWASAWQAQNVDRYLTLYHPRFQFEGFASREAWLADRRQRLGEPGYIRISLKDFEVTAQANNAARVRFWLSYVREEYGDETLKELYLVKEGNLWSIARERNLEVRAVRRD